MSVFKPRTRVVYFRLSEDQYRQYVKLCEERGARSLSDLARTAIDQLIAEPEHLPTTHLGHRFAEFERKLDHVTATLNDLVVELSKKPNVAN